MLSGFFSIIDSLWKRINFTANWFNYRFFLLSSHQMNRLIHSRLQSRIGSLLLVLLPSRQLLIIRLKHFSNKNYFIITRLVITQGFLLWYIMIKLLKVRSYCRFSCFLEILEIKYGLLSYVMSCHRFMIAAIEVCFKRELEVNRSCLFRPDNFS